MTVFAADTFLVKPRPAPPFRTSVFYATDVRFASPSAYPPSRPRGIKKLGLAYERRVLDVFEAIYADRFVTSPHILYRRDNSSHRAVPDGLLYLGNTVVIVEVKLAHTEKVWEQLVERYRGLIRILHPYARVRTVEVCRSYDPAIPIPHTRIASLHTQSAGGLEVMHWKI